MSRTHRPIRSDIAWSTAERITVRGRDLPSEILGRMSLTELSFLQLTGCEATPAQSQVYDAILITLVEHGLAPSALAARLTHAGAPESLQAAVAAGLCELGRVFVGSMEGAAQMLSVTLADDDSTVDLTEAAVSIVADFPRPRCDCARPGTSLSQANRPAHPAAVRDRCGEWVVRPISRPDATDRA